MNSTTPSTLVVCMDDAIITEFLLKRGLLHNIELPKPPRNTTELVTLSDDPQALHLGAALPRAQQSRRQRPAPRDRREE